MHDLKLPKEHLSFSQIDLWLRSKETYRKKYYGGVNFATTAAMAFGNEVTLAMAAGDPQYAFIPRFPRFEREMVVVIDGIPVKGAIDSIDDSINKFLDYKTGRTKWTQAKVNKHLQLDLYSLMLEEEDGFVDEECSIVHVEAENALKSIEMDGHILEGTSTEIRVTGNVFEYKRIITKEERAAMRALVVKVGREIEEDFAAYKHLYIPTPETLDGVGDLPRL
jgi:hypothetical protein